MELYDGTSEIISQTLMKRYSTSFSTSTMLFPKHMRKHIYNIYGLVRIADEIVDSYGGSDGLLLLNSLEEETVAAIKRRYSPNPIVHAFALSANRYTFDTSIIAAFFHSMRMDTSPQEYTPSLYKKYIHGSAEAIGLLCLSVFCDGDTAMYVELRNGAEHLGAAYQKVNFLRDIRSDYDELGRLYFPGIRYKDFTENNKQEIILDIQRDFEQALPTIKRLPKTVQPAIMLSYRYYSQLLVKLQHASVDTIKAGRIRLSGAQKALLLGKTLITRKQ